jgi:hypothetical protein
LEGSGHGERSSCWCQVAGFSVKISVGLEGGLRLEAAGGVRRDASAEMDGGAGVWACRRGIFFWRFFSVRCMPKCLWETLEQQIDVLIYSPYSQGHKRALRRAGSQQSQGQRGENLFIRQAGIGPQGNRRTQSVSPCLHRRNFRGTHPRLTDNVDEGIGFVNSPRASEDQGRSECGSVLQDLDTSS